LAISTSIRHFPYYIPKLCPERQCKDSDKIHIFAYHLERVMKSKFEKFICPKCGLQEAEVDNNDRVVCPKCNKVVQLASSDKEYIKISKPQKNQ
jgi:Zn finger protein HypA/HybF involved in hydrogenase expression